MQFNTGIGSDWLQGDIEQPMNQKYGCISRAVASEPDSFSLLTLGKHCCVSANAINDNRKQSGHHGILYNLTLGLCLSWAGAATGNAQDQSKLEA